MVKKKMRLSAHSIIPITSRLEMDFFFHTIRNNHCVMFYVTQSRLKRLFHVARDMSSEREFCCGLSQFHCRNEVKQGHIRYKQKNCRPNYILEKNDNWFRF